MRKIWSELIGTALATTADAVFITGNKGVYTVSAGKVETIRTLYLPVASVGNNELLSLTLIKVI